MGRQRGGNYHYRMINVPSTAYHSGGLNEGDDDDDDLSVMALLRAEQTAQEVGKHKTNSRTFVGFVCVCVCVFSILADRSEWIDNHQIPNVFKRQWKLLHYQRIINFEV